MTNSDYKIFARALANRLNPVIGELIHPSQAYSIPGRNIYDTLTVLRDLIELANSNNENFAILNIDFQKAFDRVNHIYLFEIIRRFGLPEGFLSFLRFAYEGSACRIKVNNCISDMIPFTNGIRQGCRLSCLLFSLAIEPLLSLVRRNFCARTGPSYFKNVTATFADDVSCFVRDLNDFAVIDTYSVVLGANVNYEKSFVLWGGAWNGRVTVPALPTPYRSDEGKFLGVYLGNSNTYVLANWPDLSSRLTKVLGRWMRYRPLCSIYGRVLLTNQLAASVLWHRLKVIQPPSEFIISWQRCLVDFLWEGSTGFRLSVFTLTGELVALALLTLLLRLMPFALEWRPIFWVAAPKLVRRLTPRWHCFVDTAGDMTGRRTSSCRSRILTPGFRSTIPCSIRGFARLG